ncbi:hypothetical protein SRHO_G00140120 [Serrasalmus rhombeus]
MNQFYCSVEGVGVPPGSKQEFETPPCAAVAEFVSEVWRFITAEQQLIMLNHMNERFSQRVGDLQLRAQIQFVFLNCLNQNDGTEVEAFCLGSSAEKLQQHLKNYSQ